MTGWLGGLEFGIRGRVSYGVLQVTQDSRFRKFQVPSDNHLDCPTVLEFLATAIKC